MVKLPELREEPKQKKKIDGVPMKYMFSGKKGKTLSNYENKLVNFKRALVQKFLTKWVSKTKSNGDQCPYSVENKRKDAKGANSILHDGELNAEYRPDFAKLWAMGGRYDTSLKISNDVSRVRREAAKENRPDFAKFWGMGGKRSVNAKNNKDFKTGHDIIEVGKPEFAKFWAMGRKRGFHGKKNAQSDESNELLEEINPDFAKLWLIGKRGANLQSLADSNDGNNPDFARFCAAGRKHNTVAKSTDDSRCIHESIKEVYPLSEFWVMGGKRNIKIKSVIDSEAARESLKEDNPYFDIPGKIGEKRSSHMKNADELKVFHDSLKSDNPDYAKFWIMG